jgi:arylsulfatase
MALGPRKAAPASICSEAATPPSPFIAEHLESLKAYPPRQAADTLSMHVALQHAMLKLQNASASSN